MSATKFREARPVKIKEEEGNGPRGGAIKEKDVTRTQVF